MNRIYKKVTNLRAKIQYPRNEKNLKELFPKIEIQASLRMCAHGSLDGEVC